MRKYSNNRSGRIADQIHKDIVAILRDRVKDPRVKWVTINDVELGKDLGLARIFWSVLNDSDKEPVARALESAQGFIRSELSKGFKTYTIPQIRFVFDESLARGAHIVKILDQVSTEATSDSGSDEEYDATRD